MATVTADNPKELVKDNLINALNEVKLAQEGKIKLDDARDLFKQFCPFMIKVRQIMFQMPILNRL